MDWEGSLHKNPLLTHTHDINQPLPLCDDSFDTVLLSDVLEHIYDPFALTHEIHRVLNTGGTLIGNTPFLYRVHEAPDDFFRYTEHALSRMLSDAGFRDAKIIPIGDEFDVIVDILGKVIVAVPGLGHTTARVLQRAWFRLWAPFRCRFRKSSPLGYFFIAEKA